MPFPRVAALDPRAPQRAAAPRRAAYDAQLAAFLNAEPSAAERSAADFAAARIRETWVDHKFGCELEFGGMDAKSATIAIAGALGVGATIKWLNNNPNASVGYGSYARARGQQVGHEIAAPGDTRAWSQEADTSVGAPTGPSGTNQGLELVSPVLTWRKDADKVARIVSALRAAGGTTDPSCGGHVHVDATQLQTGAGTYNHVVDVKRVACLVAFMYRNEPLFIKAIAEHQRRVNGFAQPIPQAAVDCMKAGGPNLDTAGAARCWQHYQHSYGLNLQHVFWPTPPKITVEFRYYNGTLDPDQELANVQLSLALALYVTHCQAGRWTDKYTYDPSANPAYDFRVFLLSLGLIGDEFSRTREIMLRNLPGWPNTKTGAEAGGRVRPRREVPAEAIQSGATAPVQNFAGTQTADPARIRDVANWSAHPQKDARIYRIGSQGGASRYFMIQHVAGDFYATFTAPGSGPAGVGHIYATEWIDHEGAGHTVISNRPAITFDSYESAAAAAAKFTEGFAAAEQRREAAAAAAAAREAERAATERAASAEAASLREAIAEAVAALGRTPPGGAAGAQALEWLVDPDQSRMGTYAAFYVGSMLTVYTVRKSDTGSWLAFYATGTDRSRLTAWTIRSTDHTAVEPGRNVGGSWATAYGAVEACKAHNRGGRRISPDYPNGRAAVALLHIPSANATMPMPRAAAPTPTGGGPGRPPEGATDTQISEHMQLLSSWDTLASGRFGYTIGDARLVMSPVSSGGATRYTVVHTWRSSAAMHVWASAPSAVMHSPAGANDLFNYIGDALRGAAVAARGYIAAFVRGETTATPTAPPGTRRPGAIYNGPTDGSLVPISARESHGSDDHLGNSRRSRLWRETNFTTAPPENYPGIDLSFYAPDGRVVALWGCRFMLAKVVGTTRWRVIAMPNTVAAHGSLSAVNFRPYIVSEGRGSMAAALRPFAAQIRADGLIVPAYARI